MSSDPVDSAGASPAKAKARPWIPWLGLGLSLLLTLGAWWVIRSGEQRRVRDRFEAEIALLENRIGDHAEKHVQILLSSAEFAAHNADLPTRMEWRHFADALDLERLTPGIQALAFTEWIPPERLEAHTARLRSEGFRDYLLRPGGPLPQVGGASSTIYLEPFSEANRPAFGKDMRSDASHREAMDRACDTGRAALTGRVRLSMEGPAQHQAGTFLYAPVYWKGLRLDTVAQRRSALRGWTCLAFRMQDRAADMVGPSAQGIDLALFDGAPEPDNLLFERKARRVSSSPAWIRQLRLTVSGRVWTLRCVPGADFQQSAGRGAHLPVLLLGLPLCAVIFLLLRSVQWAEQRAFALALERSEKLRMVLDHTAEGIYGLDLEGRCTFCNPAGLRLLGHASAECLLGRNLHTLIHHSRADGSPLAEAECGAHRALRAGIETHSEEEVFWRADGTSFPVELWSYPQRREGRLLGAVVTFMDITERKHAEESLRDLERFNRATVDSLSSHLAILDSDGRILTVNRAWRAFAESNAGRSAQVFEGVDYLAVCERLCGPRTEGVADFASGIRRILQGGQEATSLEYACHAPHEHRWFLARANPLLGAGGSPCAVITHDNITERKRAEEAAQKTAIAVEQSPASVIITNTSGAIEYVNPTFTRTTGYSPEEVLGRNPRILKSGSHPPQVYQELWDTILAGETWRGEFHNRRRNGELYWELASISPLRDAQGTVTNFVAVKEDITERKRLQGELEQVNERLSLAVRAGGVGVWEYDPVQRRSHWDDQMYSLYGVGRGEFEQLDEAWLNRLHPADRDQRNLEFQSALQGETDYDTEFRVVWPDGSIHHIRGLALLERDASGRVVRMIGTNWDITAQKEAEVAAREARDRFERMFQNSPVLMALTTLPEQRFSEVNSTFLAVLGYSRPELIGRTAQELGLFAIRGQMEAMAARLQGEGRFSEFEMDVRRKDGEIIKGLISGEVVSIQGEPFLLSVMLDITERIHGEAALLQLNATLEQRVALEVANRLTYERALIQQSRLAAMGEMVANIAHQWRQPLNALAMTLADLKDARRFGQLTDEYLESSLQHGNDLIQGMSATISDFMDFFRPDKAPIHFSPELQATSAINLVMASLRKLEISIEVSNGPEMQVLGHPNEFSQVLLNLLANARDAIQASGASGGVIRIESTREDGKAKLRVADNGGGIRATPIDRIFEPYFSDKPTGTGLGLYMSRMILEQSMNGSIEARNIPGGAEFTITLPLAECGHEPE